MTKVLVISTEFPPGPGGIGHHAYSLCNALHQQSRTITVLTPADYTDAKSTEAFDQQQPYAVLRFPRKGWRTYFLRLHLTHRAIRDIQPDHIILTGKFSLWIGSYLKLFFPDIPTMAILHGSEVNLPNRLLRRFTHYAINTADQIVAVSKFTASLLPAFIKDNRTIAIIPNGIETDELNTYLTNSEVTLNGTPALLTVGHVSPRKGQHRVIKALPAVLKVYPNAHYHIVGRPIYASQLTALAQQLGVEDHVTFHGVVKNHRDLGNYYAAADIFMLLSENQPNGDVEGFGIVALEANYFGLPVIGAKYCGVEDAVNDGSSGYLVDANNPKEIVEAVSLHDRHKEGLKAGSRIWAEQHNWKEIIVQYLNLLP